MNIHSFVTPCSSRLFGVEKNVLRICIPSCFLFSLRAAFFHAYAMHPLALAKMHKCELLHTFLSQSFSDYCHMCSLLEGKKNTFMEEKKGMRTKEREMLSAFGVIY